MKSSTKDQAEGEFHKVKGKIKEVAGKISDNPELEAEGKVEKTTGKVQKKIGQVKKVLGNRLNTEKGKVGWIILLLLGVPIPILLVLFLLRGCT